MRTSHHTPILAPLFEFPETEFAFTMCNPPFYASTEEVTRSAEGKALEPNAICTGADVEMITRGGEEAFVGAMVEESMREDIRQRCS